MSRQAPPPAVTPDPASPGLAGSLQEALSLLEETAPPNARRPGPPLWHEMEDRTRSFLEPCMERLFDAARDELFRGSREAPTNFVQAEYFDAVQEVEQARDPLVRAFFDQVAQGFARLAAGAPATPEDGGADALSLVDTQALNDIIAVQEILRRQDEDLAVGLRRLGEGFARLLGVEVDHAENPVGPYRIAYAFRDALQNMGLGAVARGGLFAALEREAVRPLGRLHEQLLGRLGTWLPAPHAPSVAGRSEAKPPGRPAPAAPARPAPDSAAPGRAAGGGPAADPGASRPPPAPAPRGAAAGAAIPPPRPAPAPAGAGRPSPAATAQLLYRLAARGDGAPPAGRAGRPPSRPRRALLAALDDIQQATRRQPPSPGERPDLYAQLTARLGGEGDAPGERGPSPGEAEGLAFATRLVGAVLDDPLVAPGVKARVIRLEPTLVRLALTSPDFLAHDYHPARRLVDLMARLALPSRPIPETFEAELAAALDAALEPALGAGEETGSFTGAAEAVEALAARQAERYARRVTAVIEAARVEEAEMAPDPGPESVRTASPTLSVGDPVLFQDADGPHPETLAWADPGGRLVFVDRYGARARTITPQRLAEMLEAGTARLLPDAGLQPLERGIYAVFQELQERVTREATRDAVTGLPNRKSFLLAGRRLLEDLDGDGAALLHIALDELGARRATLGPEATRALLARYAAVLEKHFGARSTLGALDEGTFTVILRGSGEDALGLADQHRYSIFESRVKWRGRTLPLTVSIGVVELTRAEALEAQLQSAAIACRKAQKDGGNRTQAYRPGIAHLVAQTRVDWTDAITRALAEDQLRLARQRIEPLAAGDGALPHYEILLRLQGPGGEALAPGELIGAAERAGRMPEVDRWVLGRTLAWIAADPRRLEGVGGYAVNLSGQTLGSEAAVADLERMLACGRVPPGRILLEVTETAAIECLRAANAAIERLRALGCRFCLDDFGTGAATYSYLKHLSVDYVKIDGMFVKDIVDSPSDLAMVRSVNEVSHYMGKRTIAEFVETPRVRELLGSLGVDYGQGYSIHRPELLPDFPPARALDCGGPPVPD